MQVDFESKRRSASTDRVWRQFLVNLELNFRSCPKLYYMATTNKAWLCQRPNRPGAADSPNMGRRSKRAFRAGRLRAEVNLQKFSSRSARKM
uniref:Uncharacterized protein n=1 Tax=Romanomermis culicivorax TaxID=13658 RepID=A0A915HRJ8_ROMCU